jgi:hypothetical protein
MLRGGSVKVANLIVIASLLIASAAYSAASMPNGWDPKIPLPPGAVLVSTKYPKTGVVYSATYVVAGDYQQLVDFYEKEIPKAGFVPGPKVMMPARKVYNRSFSRKSTLDSVVITPSPDHPDKFELSITYTAMGK